MSQRGTYIKVSLAVSALVVAGLVYSYWPFHLTPQPPHAPQNVVPAVTVINPTMENVPLEAVLPGRTVAYQIAEVRPQVGGIILERLFEEGADVNEKQQLYQIDPAYYQATVDSAEADVKKATANITALQAKAGRFEELVEIEAVSKQEYADVSALLAQADADLAIANATLKTAKLNLKYTEVLAPISGRIGKSVVTKGALVTANQPVAVTTIIQLDPVYVDLTLPSEEISRIRKIAGSRESVSITLLTGDNDTPYEHQGALQFADVAVDPSTHSVLLRAKFPNPDRVLLPGAFVRAHITLENIDAFLVPQRAVILMPDGSASVWVVESANKVARRKVATLKTYGGQWVVTEGISEKDTIVVEGYQQLRPGMTVQPSFPETTTRAMPNSTEKH